MSTKRGSPSRRLAYERQQEGDWVPPSAWRPSGNGAITNLKMSNAETSPRRDDLEKRGGILTPQASKEFPQPVCKGVRGNCKLEKKSRSGAGTTVSREDAWRSSPSIINCGKHKAVGTWGSKTRKNRKEFLLRCHPLKNQRLQNKIPLAGGRRTACRSQSEGSRRINKTRDGGGS